MKKRIISMAVAFLFITLLATTAQAHTGDYLSGGYITNKQNNLQFLIADSAQTSLLNEDVYENSATGWNSVGANIHVSVVMRKPGMPTSGDFMYVYGDYNGTVIDEDEFGITCLFDSNGNPVSIGSNWAKVIIYMNTSGIFGEASNPTEAARKTFIHEVGHALKLNHPDISIRHTGHNIPYRDTIGDTYYLPVAVMNQGFPDGIAIASNISQHDKDNLIAKWGV